MEDALANLFNAPISTLLTLSGILVLVFSVLIEFKNSSGRGKGTAVGGRRHISVPGTLIGVFLLLIGVFYQPLSVLANNAILTPTPSVVPSQAVDIEPETGDTENTEVPPMPTTAPVSTMPTLPALTGSTLKKGCIAESTWKAAASDEDMQSKTSTIGGCLIPSGIGAAAEKDGILRVVQTAKNGPVKAGIYTPINKTAVIELNVRIRNLYIADATAPASIDFAIAPANAPLDAMNSARFRLFVDTVGNDALVYFVLADPGEFNGAKVANLRYQYGWNYAIRLELNGSLMTSYINNVKVPDNISLPAGDAVLLISYNLPSQAGTEVEITEIRIDGVEK